MIALARLRVCLSLAAVLCAAPPLWSAPYFAIAPEVNQEPLQHLTAVLADIELELADARVQLTTGAVGIERLSSGLCGPAFLAHNPEHPELDYFALIYLGRVPANPETPGYAAKDIMLRIESWMSAVEKSGRHRPSSVWQFDELGGVTSEGKLEHAEQTEALLTKSLDHIYDRTPYGHVTTIGDTAPRPVHFGPKEIGILSLTRARFFSTEVRYRPEMFAGVRQVSIVFHFVADIDFRPDEGRRGRLIRNVQIHPLDERTHTLRRAGDLLLEAMFPRREAATALVQRAFVPLDSSLEELRVAGSQRELEAARRSLALGDRAQALIQLHRSFDAIAPLVPTRRKTELKGRLAECFGSDAVLKAQAMAEMADVLQRVIDRESAYQAFLGSGALRQVGEWLTETTAELRGSHEERVGKELDEVDAALASLRFRESPSAEDREQWWAALATVSRLGRQMALWIGPSDYQFTVMVGSIERMHERMGYRRVRAWALPDAKLGLFRDDLSGINEPFASGDFSPLPALDPNAYALIGLDDLHGSMADDPSAVYYLLVGGTGRAVRDHQRLWENLFEADEAFELDRWTGKKRELKWPKFLDLG